LAAGAGRDSRKRAELGLPPIEQVVADLATQLTADEDRPAAFQALLGSRLRTLVECHRHRREPGMRAAWRACLIEAASICVLLAGRLPPPDIPARLERKRQTHLPGPCCSERRCSSHPRP
jgi:hypothetical protein